MRWCLAEEANVADHSPQRKKERAAHSAFFFLLFFSLQHPHMWTLTLPFNVDGGGSLPWSALYLWCIVAVQLWQAPTRLGYLPTSLPLSSHGLISKVSTASSHFLPPCVRACVRACCLGVCGFRIGPAGATLLSLACACNPNPLCFSL